MKNRELAAYYAALPPDEVATISVVNQDTRFISVEQIERLDDAILEDFEEEEREDAEIGTLCIQIKW